MTEGDGKLALTDDDPDILFIHSLVNYAKAKQRAAGMMKILHERQSDERRPETTQSLRENDAMVNRLSVIPKGNANPWRKVWERLTKGDDIFE